MRSSFTEQTVGLITDGTREGTVIVDPQTEKWAEAFPPIRSVEYDLQSKTGYGSMTVTIDVVACRIVAEVAAVEWRDHRYEICEPMAGFDHLIGSRIRVECEGTFASCTAVNDDPDGPALPPCFGANWKMVNGAGYLTLICANTERMRDAGNTANEDRLRREEDGIGI